MPVSIRSSRYLCSSIATTWYYQIAASKQPQPKGDQIGNRLWSVYQSIALLDQTVASSSLSVVAVHVELDKKEEVISACLTELGNKWLYDYVVFYIIISSGSMLCDWRCSDRVLLSCHATVAMMVVWKEMWKCSWERWRRTRRCCLCLSSIHSFIATWIRRERSWATFQYMPLFFVILYTDAH